VSVNAGGQEAMAGHRHHADDIFGVTSAADCPKQVASGGENPGGINPGTPGDNPGGSNPGNENPGGGNPATGESNPPQQTGGVPGSVGGTTPEQDSPAGSAPATNGVAPAGTPAQQAPAGVAGAVIPANQPAQPEAVLGVSQAPAQAVQPDTGAQGPEAVLAAFQQPLALIPAGMPDTGYGSLANLNIANQGLKGLILLVLGTLLAIVSTIEFMVLKPKAKTKK